jgi:hypothetical protein
VSKANPMQATPQMTQSTGVRRRDLPCAVDRIACFPQKAQLLIGSSSCRKTRMAAGTYQTSEITVNCPSIPITNTHPDFNEKE